MSGSIRSCRPRRFIIIINLVDRDPITVLVPFLVAWYLNLKLFAAIVQLAVIRAIYRTRSRNISWILGNQNIAAWRNCNTGWELVSCSLKTPWNTLGDKDCLAGVRGAPQRLLAGRRRPHHENHLRTPRSLLAFRQRRRVFSLRNGSPR